MSCWSRISLLPRHRSVFLLSMGLLLAGAAPAAAETTPVALQSLGKCLAVPSSDPYSAPVVMAACGESPAQAWLVPPRGFSGRIVGPGGYCLDVTGGFPEDRTPLIVFPCHGLPNQIWRHEADGRIVGLAGKCIDVLGSGTADGTPAVLFRCAEPAATSNQRWRAEQRNAFHPEPLLSGAFLSSIAAVTGHFDRIFAAGRQHGVLRSENGGADWTSVHRGVDLTAGVEQIAVDPLQPDRIVALQNGKVLRSLDSGRIFSASPRVEPPHLRSLAFDPLRAGHLLSTDGTQVFESVDGGEYFYRRDFPTQQSPATLQQVIFDPLVPRRWWIAAAATCAFCTGPDQGIFRSDDEGASWNRVFDQPSHRLVADPQASGHLYALVAQQVYRTTDGGGSWQLLANFGAPVLDLWADSSFPGILLVSHRLGVVRSFDGGATFLPVPLGLRPGPGGQPGEVVRSFLQVAGRLYAAVDGVDGHPGRGVIESPDLGTTWSLSSERGFTAASVADVEGDPAAAAGILVATREGVYRSTDGGATYLRTLATEGPASATALLVDPHDATGRTVYAAGSRAAGAAGPFLWKSADAGATWNSVAGNAGQAIATGGFVATQAAGKRVYLTTLAGTIGGTSYQGVISTDTDGLIWKPVQLAVPVRLLANGALPGLVYAAGAGLLRSLDGGVSWQQLPGIAEVDAMSAHGGDLYLASQGFFRVSSDHGLSFASVELPAAIARPSSLFAAGDRVYLGDRAGGVFASADRGLSWTALDLGLPASGVRALHAAPGAPGRLWAGTEAAGLHRAVVAPEKAPLHFAGGRFTATITWKDFVGATGAGRAGAWNADSGFFWFFLPDNVEVMVKVLDGALINGNYWVFVGSLSNVEFALTVRDEWTGAERVYENPLGTFASFGDIEAFPAAPGAIVAPTGTAPTGTAASGTAIASPLEAAPAGAASQVVTVRDRFEISVTWEDGFGQFGQGFGRRMTADTAAFNFFSATNTELVIKVLDGTSINGHDWVFYGALSDVGYVITVRDTATGEQAIYHNPVGQFGSVGDIEAF